MQLQVSASVSTPVRSIFISIFFLRNKVFSRCCTCPKTDYFWAVWVILSSRKLKNFQCALHISYMYLFPGLTWSSFMSLLLKLYKNKSITDYFSTLFHHSMQLSNNETLSLKNPVFLYEVYNPVGLILAVIRKCTGLTNLGSNFIPLLKFLSHYRKSIPLYIASILTPVWFHPINLSATSLFPSFLSTKSECPFWNSELNTI